MPTAKQDLGKLGERAVCKHVKCPQCNRDKQLRPLTQNFECVDVICKFCGFLAQVKATTLPQAADARPDRVLGAAWGPQHQRIISGIFHALYVVGFDGTRLKRIDYIPAHMLEAYPSVFKPRTALSETAKRAGWQGFIYDLRELPDVGSIQVFPGTA
jgi:type II restriction enzyme